jgi:hypothetical protein
MSGRCGCGLGAPPVRTIEGLAQESLSAVIRYTRSGAENAYAIEAATPGGPITLPGEFSGWMKPISLVTLLAPDPPLPYGTTSSPALYRIYEEGKQIPLYIGMVTRASIAARVASHMRGLFIKSGALAKTALVKSIAAVTPADFDRKRSEIAKMRVLVAQSARVSGLKVQHGTVRLEGGRNPDAKLLHAYEAALQVRERPRSYVGSVWSFEDAIAIMNG